MLNSFLLFAPHWRTSVWRLASVIAGVPKDSAKSDVAKFLENLPRLACHWSHRNLARSWDTSFGLLSGFLKSTTLLTWSQPSWTVMYASAFGGGSATSMSGVQLELYSLAVAVVLLSLAIFYIGFLMQMFFWTVTWILFLLFENTWIHSAQVTSSAHLLLSVGDFCSLQ